MRSNEKIVYLTRYIYVIVTCTVYKVPISAVVVVQVIIESDMLIESGFERKEKLRVSD